MRRIKGLLCSSSVLTIIRSISSSVIERGSPGRGSSCSPSRPRRAKRPLHLPTVVALQPKRAALSLLRSPAAAASTIRQRNANACELFWAPGPSLQHRPLFVAEDNLHTLSHNCLPRR
jgi:hypothetical protein